MNHHGRFRDSDILRKVFEKVARQCMAAGLIKGKGFAVDTPVIEATASRFQRITGAEVDWTEEQIGHRAIREFIAAIESETPAHDEVATRNASQVLNRGRISNVLPFSHSWRFYPGNLGKDLSQL